MFFPAKITFILDGIILENIALKGCVSQGTNLKEAIQEYEDNEIAWLNTAKAYNFDIPNPSDYKEEGFWSENGSMYVKLPKNYKFNDSYKIPVEGYRDKDGYLVVKDWE